MKRRYESKSRHDFSLRALFFSLSFHFFQFCEHLEEILETREEEASKRFRACTCSIINRFSPWKPQLLIRTAHDLHKLYPKVVPSIQISKMNDATVQQGLAFFYNALKSVGDSWTENHKWLTTFGCKKDVKIEDIASQEFENLVEH
ncbi:hypothetical protein NE237_014265 [Protea cynaroides]|uniref:Uncharacterized protein n=1 Tax=Protea cynaroides TaxID=273540 RepID=A0A9Q0GK48_9MAGN|nr:hypothetical protein NE237_014265 [Protea cynaroides]